MNSLLKTLAMASKEIQLLTKDKGFLFVIFLLPILIASLTSAMNSGGGEESIILPIALINQDSGKHGKEIADLLFDIDMLRIEELDSVETANNLVADGELIAAVIIPADFTDQVLAYEQTEVQVVLDPTQARYGSIITTILEEVVEPIAIQGELRYGMSAVLNDSGLYQNGDPAQVTAAEAQEESILDAKMDEIKENPQIKIRAEDLEGADVVRPNNMMLIFAPGFTVMFAFFLVPTLAAELLKEKEEGSLRRLIAAPISKGAIIGGKILAFLVLTVIQVALVFGVANIAFDMPLGNSYLGLFLITLTLGFAVTTLGMMLAALVRSHTQASSVGTMLVFVLAALGSAIQLGPYPFFQRDDFLGFMSRLTPHAHALLGYQSIMVKGGALEDVLPQIAVLAGMSILFFVVAIWRFRFE